MLRMKAMRYYRLWIYACNLVLLVSVLLFVVVGSSIFGDARMSLVSGVRYYQPTFLYAYAATVLQGGVIQVIGCIGALRLNERLLNVYWLVLLFLLCGDLVVGTVWVFRFQRLCAELPGELSRRLATEYGVQPEFTALWDHVQWADRCCGVESPSDFNASSWRWRTGVGVGDESGVELLPASCCPGRPLVVAPLPPPPKAEAYRSRKWHSRYAPQPPPTLQPPPTTPVPPYNGTCVPPDAGWESAPYGRGCKKPLMLWYERSADLLFVLGYCVIAFLKLCFLGLLRCEIREMIQKIKVLECEADAVERAETVAGAPLPLPLRPTANHVTKDNNNGGGGGGGGGGGAGGGGPGGGPGGGAGGGGGVGGHSGGVVGSPPCHRPMLDETANTSDSETNSHCPLLGRPRRAPNGNNNKLSANRNEAHELLELRPRQQTDI